MGTWIPSPRLLFSVASSVVVNLWAWPNKQTQIYPIRQLNNSINPVPEELTQCDRAVLQCAFQRGGDENVTLPDPPWRRMWGCVSSRSVVVATVIPGSCNLFRPTNQEQQHEGCFAGVFVVMLPPALTWTGAENEEEHGIEGGDWRWMVEDDDYTLWCGIDRDLLWRVHNKISILHMFRGLCMDKQII